MNTTVLQLGITSLLKLATETSGDPVLVDLGVSVASPKRGEDLRGRGSKLDLKPKFCRRCGGSTLVDRMHQDACRCQRPKGPGA